jgi:hypothetical protein
VLDTVDGLISAVVVTVRGAAGATPASVAATRAPPEAASTAASVDVTVSADRVEVGGLLGALGASVDDPFGSAVAFAVCGVADDFASGVVLPSDVVTVVLAPPLARTVPSRGSAEASAGVGSGSDPGFWVVSVSTVAAAVGVSVFAVVSTAFESGWVSVDSDPVPSGVAMATPGEVTTATPMPSATASAPTRPT